MDTLRLQVILDGIDRATKPLQGILQGTNSLAKAAKDVTTVTISSDPPTTIRLVLKFGKGLTFSNTRA